MQATVVVRDIVRDGETLAEQSVAWLMQQHMYAEGDS
jgi:hypothetical protein